MSGRIDATNGGAALGFTRILDGFLFGIEPGDPMTLLTVAAVLMIVSIFACLVPARRAAGVDPVCGNCDQVPTPVSTSVHSAPSLFSTSSRIAAILRSKSLSRCSNSCTAGTLFSSANSLSRADSN